MDAPINVLVVDDVSRNLAATEALLVRPDLAVLKAGSGAEALELLLTHEVALALVDVQMPDMDGFELAELMRGATRTRDVPIIFLTAAADDPARMFRGYEAGAVDFLQKPIDTRILKSKVDVFVELYSQRRRLAAQLDELKSALRLNEMFSAVLGHDLRNPLNAIGMGAEVLLRQSDDPKVVTTAERIRSGVQRMANMIAELLDLARIRQGGVQLKLTPADIHEVCRTVTDELESAKDTRRIALTAKGDTRATVDIDRMAQILSNLLGNALRHGAAGPVQAEVDGSAVGAVTVCIRNRGVIPQDQAKSLFEPFHPGRGSHEGLGLGLYIAKQFILAHGGTVKAISDEKTQTVFELCVPRTPPAGGREKALRLEL